MLTALACGIPCCFPHVSLLFGMPRMFVLLLFRYPYFLTLPSTFVLEAKHANGCSHHPTSATPRAETVCLSACVIKLLLFFFFFTFCHLEVLNVFESKILIWLSRA